METKKFYTAPKTEVFMIQTESMCAESAMDVKGSLGTEITSGNLTKERDLDSAFGDLW